MYILFSDSDEALCSLVSVPHSMQNSGGLIIAILPWQKSPEDFANERLGEPWYNILGLDMEKSAVGKVSGEGRQSISYESALAILAMPDDILLHLQRKSYCIWAASVEEDPLDSGMDFESIYESLSEETKALIAVFEEKEAQNVGFKAFPEMIFIHVAALGTVNKLPGLVEIRENHNETSFFTYGRHDSIDPRYWGVHKLYPIYW